MIRVVFSSVRTVLGVCLLATSLPALAGETSSPEVSPVFGIEFELGAGGVIAPRYEGASDYEISPFPVIRLERLDLGGLSFGGEDTLGFSLYPWFRYLDERKASDVAALPGLPSVNAAIELGFGASYEQEYWRVFGNIRHGVTGHDGLVGELGADLIIRPEDEWRLSLGPRISFATNDYMDRYFGIPTGIPGLVGYDPSGGLKSAGVEAAARYQFAPQWAVEGSLGWSRLLSDAADSPIGRQGDEDQIIGRISVMRRFSFGLAQ